MKEHWSNDINIFLSLENPCTFLLVKEDIWKRIFNNNSELPQNRTEKQIMPSKTTTNWLFNDIWCYLFIASFDWKIGIFQQTVVKVYYILIWQNAPEKIVKIICLSKKFILIQLLLFLLFLDSKWKLNHGIIMTLWYGSHKSKTTLN